METDLLKDRVFDTANIAEKTNCPKFFGFLTEEQAIFAKRLLENQRFKFDFFGGYSEAKRVMLCCLPDWADEAEYPIVGITAVYRKTDILSHRDFLGSLMALGLKRETVGDILIEDGRAVIFLTDKAAKYVLCQVEKVGKVGVKLSLGFEEPLPKVGVLKEFTETVASERLDCVVSAVAGISRSLAVEKIEQSMVTVNSVIIEKPTRQVNEGDIISVRGKGKFIIDSVKDKTKKDRIILKYRKYV